MENNTTNWTANLVYDYGKRRSELCKAKDYQADWFLRWCNELDETPNFHRKQWEFVYVMQALWERGCIAEGKKGLVFAVGTEPLPAMFAKYGCNILATDIFPEQGIAKGWTTGNQLCFGLDQLNTRNICPNEKFLELVKYKPVDMNDIPDDLTDFDFNWSSCSFEHLGSLEKGMSFLKNQLKTLKPGGWAVHTTEFNVSSNTQTRDNDDTVIYRQKDIEKIVGELRAAGHFVEELDFSMGGLEQDYRVDVLPHKQDIHLKIQIYDYVATSIGLIIQKSS
jgi:SAM-dependent methyltransferase